MKQEKKTEIKALLATIVGHIFWGFSFLASRTALNTGHMFLLLSHRFLLAFFVMNLLLLFRLTELRLRGKRVVLLLLLALAEPVVYFFGEQYGILHSNTIFSGVMIAMIPLICTLAAAPILGERPTWGQLLFSLVSVGGVVGIGLMSKGSGALDWLGVAALAVAVIAAAAYTLLSRGVSDAFTPFERTYMMMAMGAVVFTVLAAIYCRGNLAAYLQPLSDRPYLLSILFLALLCSVGSYFLSAYALTYMTVAREVVFSNLTTAVSVFAGAVFLHEPFSPWGVLSCAMILLGIYGVQRAAPKENEQSRRGEAKK